MNEHLINFQEASENVFLAAAYLAETIGSSDGRAEAVKEIVERLLKRDNVDLAAQFADTIEDSFARDRLLCDVAEKCAALDDDEYARQLAEAIEDEGFQSIALDRIAAQKALLGQFDQASAIALQLAHPADAWATIAVSRAAQGNLEEALNNIGNIELETSKINALLEIAARLMEENDKEKALEITERAYNESNEIDYAEDKIRALLNISERFSELERKDRAIEILSEAKGLAETLDGAHRQGFLSQISFDFLRAGSLDLADRTLDLVTDKTQIAACLANFSDEFAKRGEETEARETLDEAYAVLKSQPDREVRDTALKFSVLNAIADRYAEFGNFDRALEIALENPLEEGRHKILVQIAYVCFEKGNAPDARRAIDLIADDYTKLTALVGAYDLLRKKGETEEAKQKLREAEEAVESVAPPASRSTIHNKLSQRFYALEEASSARRHAFESLKIISRITDESLRATALATLGDWYDEAKFETTAEEKDVLRTMLRRAEW